MDRYNSKKYFLAACHEGKGNSQKVLMRVQWSGNWNLHDQFPGSMLVRGAQRQVQRHRRRLGQTASEDSQSPGQTAAAQSHRTVQRTASTEI